jgi:hypothetical protein
MTAVEVRFEIVGILLILIKYIFYRIFFYILWELATQPVIHQGLYIPMITGGVEN